MNIESLTNLKINNINSMYTTDKLVENFINEKLVDIYTYSNGNILSDNQYYKRGIKGAINKSLVRESVAKKLVGVSIDLGREFKIKILDGWRPYGVQRSLYYDYLASLVDTNNYEETKIKDLRNIVKEFVSMPSKNERVSYVHSSGGAIDLTLVDKENNEIHMGSEFDEFSNRSNTRYYEENNIDKVAQENRRILYNLMIKHGFTNLNSEWWHYDYGDKFWAINTGNEVKYSSIFELPNYLEEVIIHG